MVADAIARTGLSNFGFDLDGLQVLCRSLREEADLTPLGTALARGTIASLLRHRLRLMGTVADGPPIVRPVFLVSLPRSGSTLLFNLLALHSELRAPLTWELQSPFPRPGDDPSSDDERMERSRCSLEELYRLIPAVHEVRADWPQECMVITAHAFKSMHFGITYRVSSYIDWLVEQDQRDALTLHRRYLQHLQRDTRRWLLKSPGHLAALPDIVATYPDASFVYLHRDASDAMSSAASASYARLIRTCRSADPSQTADLQLRAWSAAWRRFQQGHPDGIRVQYESLAADPVGVAQSVLDHLGLIVSPNLERRMRAFLGEYTRPRHDYSPLDPARVRAAFASDS